MVSRGQKTIYNSIKKLEAALLHSSTHSMIFAVRFGYVIHVQAVRNKVIANVGKMLG
jgi:hypothetical protein